MTRGKRIRLGILLSMLPLSANAKLTLSGPQAFQNQVNTCFELFSAADSETKAIADRVRAPTPQGKENTLTSGALPAGVAGRTRPGGPGGRMGPNGRGAGAN